MAYIPGGSNSVTLAQSKALQNKRKADAKKKAEQAAQRQGANLTGQATSGSLGTPSTPAAVKAVADAVAAATNTKPTFTPPKSNNSSNSNRSSYTPPPAVKPPVSVTGGSMVRGGNIPTRKQEPPKYQYGSGKPIANPKSGGGSTVSGEYAGSGNKAGVNKEFGRDSNRSTYEQRMNSQRLAMNVRENPTTAVGEWAQLFDPLAGLARVGSGGERFNAIDDNSAENYGAVDAGFDVLGAVPLVGAGLKLTRGVTKGLQAGVKAGEKVLNSGVKISNNMHMNVLDKVFKEVGGVKSAKEYKEVINTALKKIVDDSIPATENIIAKGGTKTMPLEKAQENLVRLHATKETLEGLSKVTYKNSKAAIDEISTELPNLIKDVNKAPNAVRNANKLKDTTKIAKGADEAIEGMASDAVFDSEKVTGALGKGKGGSKKLVDEAAKAVKNAADETGKKIDDAVGKGADAAKGVDDLAGNTRAARDAYRAAKNAEKAARPPVGISKKGLIGGGALALGGGIMIGEAGRGVRDTATGEEGQELLYEAILGPDTTDTTDTTATNASSSGYIPGSRNTLGGGTTTPSGPTTPSIGGVAPPLNTPVGEIPFYQNPDGTITGVNSNGDTVFQTSIYSVDENGNYVETPGYIINGQTYFDAEGTQRLPEGGQYAVVNPYYTGEEGSTQPMLWGMDSVEGGNPTLTAEELENYFLDNIQDEEDMTTFDSFMEPYQPYLESEYARIDAEVEAQIRALREEAAARGLYNADAMLMMEQEIRAAGEAQKTSLYASILAEVQAKYMDYLTKKEERAQELYMYETSLDFDRQRADAEDQQWFADFQQNSQRNVGSGGGSSVVTPPSPSEAYNILSYYQELFEQAPSQQSFTSRMYGLADALRGAGYDDATVRQFLSEFSSRITSMYPDISPYK